MMKSRIARNGIAVLSMMLALSSTAKSVPNPPASQQDRIGIYNWNVDATSWPGSPDRLNWAANLVPSFPSTNLEKHP